MIDISDYTSVLSFYKTLYVIVNKGNRRKSPCGTTEGRAPTKISKIL